MTPAPHDEDDHRLARTIAAVEGYIELGMLEEAIAEMESVPHSKRLEREALQCRATLCMAAGAHDQLLVVADRLTSVWPGDPEHWIWKAWATRRVIGIPEAREILLQAVALHPECPSIWYNLACYAAVSGDMDEAWQRLDRAIHIDNAYRKLAQDDPDLEPLWKALEE